MFERIQKNTDGSKEYAVVVSMLEIYHSRVQDLLINPRNRTPKGLKVMEQASLGVFVGGLSKYGVSTAEELENIITQGLKNKAVGCTLFNKQSSRSHTILQIELTHSTKVAGSASRSQKKSVMTFVDLPGREKLDTSQNQKDRLADSWEINKGLLGLQRVVDALLEKKTANNNQSRYNQVPYQSANLTSILKEALGGNCKTYVLCTIQPGARCADQT